MSSPLAVLRAVLNDRYDVEREIGRGGMATVYLARDRADASTVAIKVLIADVSQMLGAQRFRREIELTTRLSHPNILPVRDWGQTGESLYYVMPYVAGESHEWVLSVTLPLGGFEVTFQQLAWCDDRETGPAV